MQGLGGAENASEPNSHYATNFILEKLGNSLLTARGDKARLHFVPLANLYPAHKF